MNLARVGTEDGCTIVVLLQCFQLSTDGLQSEIVALKAEMFLTGRFSGCKTVYCSYMKAIWQRFSAFAFILISFTSILYNIGIVLCV